MCDTDSSAVGVKQQRVENAETDEDDEEEGRERWEMEEEGDESVPCRQSLPCNPRRGLHRYLILIPMSLLCFGGSFCYDTPAALQDKMISDLDISTSKFMEFYSWYSWPNVILNLFSGYLLDTVLGVRFGTIFFASLLTIGQITFAVGAMLNQFWLMCLARLVFGVGVESLQVSQGIYGVKWFEGRELSLAFGLQSSLYHLGNSISMNVMEPIYTYIDETTHGFMCLGITLLIAATSCLASVLSAVLMAYFDRRADGILKRSSTASEKVLQLRDVRYFGTEFWLLNIVCATYYVGVLPFIGLGLLRKTPHVRISEYSVFFQMKFGLDTGSAVRVNSLVSTISAVATPVFGFIVDKSGRNISWVLLGTSVTLASHALLAFTFVTPYVAMSTMGLGYSILSSSLWPIAAFVVEKHQLGTAYGIMQAIQNGGFGTMSIAAGRIVDTAGYLLVELFFIAWLWVALIAAVLLYLVDGAKGGNLNRSTKDRRQDLDDAKGGQEQTSAKDRKHNRQFELELQTKETRSPD